MQALSMSTSIFPELNATIISHAKKRELQLWIDIINSAEHRKVIARNQNVPQLRAAIASYLKISLDAMPSTNASEEKVKLNVRNTAAVQVDHSLRMQQYKGLFNLGLEWQKAAAQNQRFQLLPVAGVSIYD